jgi:hypothetical protein
LAAWDPGKLGGGVGGGDCASAGEVPVFPRDVELVASRLNLALFASAA